VGLGLAEETGVGVGVAEALGSGVRAGACSLACLSWFCKLKLLPVSSELVSLRLFTLLTSKNPPTVEPMSNTAITAHCILIIERLEFLIYV
jgi:hypothetical protein